MWSSGVHTVGPVHNGSILCHLLHFLILLNVPSGMF